ncbi:MAG: hypothetical protein NTZ44_04085 [Candidatus Nomurabacteria bacterium]|nr:hypothetical protein [Candidatus Nomurabacteria bacterium]
MKKLVSVLASVVLSITSYSKTEVSTVVTIETMNVNFSAADVNAKWRFKKADSINVTYSAFNETIQMPVINSPSTITYFGANALSGQTIYHIGGLSPNCEITAKVHIDVFSEDGLTMYEDVVTFVTNPVARIFVNAPKADESLDVNSLVNGCVNKFSNQYEDLVLTYNKPQKEVNKATIGNVNANKVIYNKLVHSHKTGKEEGKYSFTEVEYTDSTSDFSVTFYNIEGYDAIYLNCSFGKDKKVREMYITEKTQNDLDDMYRINYSFKTGKKPVITYKNINQRLQKKERRWIKKPKKTDLETLIKHLNMICNYSNF